MPRSSRHPAAAARSAGPRLAADFPAGSFAFVMATGIVSIAAARLGLDWIATPLLAVNLVAFPVLWLLLLLRLRHHPVAVLADVSQHQRAPSLLTIVAGTCVLGNQVSLLTDHQTVALGLWIVAAAIWAGLVYCPFALTIRPTKPALDSGLDGSWLLIVVATEALAIAATRASTMVSRPDIVALAGLCLFLLGGALYLILLVLIVYRWLFWPMSPDQLVPSYWINMGAAAITTLAGARLLPLIGPDPALGSARGFVLGETVMFWSLATWWIPLLAVLTVWRHRGGAVPLVYRLENWSIVFPLGMYTAASWSFSQALGLPFLAVVPRIFVWIAIMAWCVTFAGMIRRLGGLRRRYGVVPPTGGGL